MKSETDFTRWFCKELERVNCQVTAFVASEMQMPGIPDRHVVHKTLPQGQVWLEFKKDRGTLRACQKVWLEERVAHGVHALIVRWRPPTTFTIESIEGAVLVAGALPMRHPAGVKLREKLCEALALQF